MLQLLHNGTLEWRPDRLYDISIHKAGDELERSGERAPTPAIPCHTGHANFQGRFHDIPSLFIQLDLVHFYRQRRENHN